MKLIETQNAVGHVLCHDMTQIIPNEKKEAVFRKGHVVSAKDVEVLLSMGKKHLYVWEKTNGMVHEDDAARILGEICQSEGMIPSEIKEGKIQFTAAADGLYQIDKERLDKINGIGEIIIASRHGNFPVHKGDKLVAARVIPLVIEEEKLELARRCAGDLPLCRLRPLQSRKAVILVTGSEVYSGRIKDAFGPAIKRKLQEYETEVLYQKILDDDPDAISREILKAGEEGAELILCTGGMSVDPDDTTPSAIRRTGAELVSYGAPVLPGAMFLLAYLNQIPIVGLPGCVMYNERTIFDLILPRLLAGDILKQQDLTSLGEGGLCLGCEICHFPNCEFGK